jgi:two-component system, cell cycle sensor histidine kinase and response regulator CckA
VRPRLTKSNAWAVAGLVGAVATTLYFFLPSPTAQAVLFIAFGAATCASIPIGLRLHRVEVPLPWLLLAAGFGLKVLGDVVWYAENLMRGADALVVPANLCYFLAYSFLIASFVVFVRLRAFRNLRAVALDTAMLLVNASVISWMFLMHPMLVSSSSWVERLVFTSYPVLHLLVLGAIVSLLLSNGPRPPALYMLTGGLLSQIAGDTVYYAGAMGAGYDVGSAMDALWLLGNVLVAMAVLAPSMSKLQGPRVTSGVALPPARIAWFAVAALIGPAALLVNQADRITIFQAVGIFSSLLLFLLVLTRMAGLVYNVQSQFQDLQRSAQEYRALAHNFPNGAVLLFDRDLRFLVADGTGLKNAGFASGDLEGSTVHEVLTPTMAARVEPHFRNTLAGQTSSAQIAARDRIYELHAAPVQDERGEVFAGLILAQDVTTRKRTETLLARQATTMEMILGGAHLKDVLGHIAEAVEEHTPGARCSILLLDRDGSTLRHSAAPSLPAAYNHAVDGLTIGPTVGSCGTAAFTGAEVSVSDIATDPLWADYKDLALMYGLRACFSSPITNAEHRTLGTFAIYYDRPIEPPAEHLEVVRLFTHLAGIALERSVSAERGAELENQLRQSQKMDAMGQLAGGIAHDFNNILSVIRNYAIFVRDEFSHENPAREDAEEIVRASDRAGDLVRQLLAFARKDVANPQVLDLNDTVGDTQKLFRRTIRENLSLSVDLAPGHPSTKLDPGQLDQILLNLVVNARDAMPEGGTLTIATGYQTIDHPHPHLATGRYVTLSVTDTGCGVTDSMKERIFEPFFTTKAPGEGTGLGLAMVYGIVDAAGGHVAVESEPGNGATFTLFLPEAVEPKHETTGQILPQATPISEGHCILVVEDEEAVRRLVGRILTGSGYRVIEADSGTDALAQLEADGRVDLLLTDVRMPGMSGRELALNVQMLYPRIRVLYMSGYAEEALADNSIRGQDSWIQKPFSAEALLAVVGRTLEPLHSASVGATSLD